MCVSGVLGIKTWMAVFSLEKIGVYLLIGEATQTWDCFVCNIVNSVPT